MEASLDLFFELSNEERYRALQTLRSDPAKLTKLAERLQLPNQEVSRQLTRLSTLDLVYKDSEGSYHTTPYADNVLSLIPGFDFLSGHRKYFRNHSTEGLPAEFRLRLGELVGCTPLGDVLTGLEDVRQTVCEASEYLWFIQEQANIGIADCVEDAIRRGVEYKVIFPSDIVPSEHYVKYIRTWKLGHPMLSKKAERRYLPSLPLSMMLSDKEVAQIAFLTVEGKTDYQGFKSHDDEAKKWCRDVFMYSWGHATEKPPDAIREILA